MTGSRRLRWERVIDFHDLRDADAWGDVCKSDACFFQPSCRARSIGQHLR